MCRCIIGWVDDPEVNGSHNQSPISCDEYILALEVLIRSGNADSSLLAGLQKAYGVPRFRDVEVASPPAMELKDGHLFKFSVDCRGVFGVSATEERYEENDWSGPPMVFEVRAWSLVDALRKAAELPFEVLVASLVDEEPVEEEPDGSGS